MPVRNTGHSHRGLDISCGRGYRRPRNALIGELDRTCLGTSASRLANLIRNLLALPSIDNMRQQTRVGDSSAFGGEDGRFVSQLCIVLCVLAAVPSGHVSFRYKGNFFVRLASTLLLEARTSHRNWQVRPSRSLWTILNGARLDIWVTDWRGVGNFVDVVARPVTPIG